MGKFTFNGCKYEAYEYLFNMQGVYQCVCVCILTYIVMN